MKILWRYMKPYTKECIAGPLFKLLEASFELFVPLVVAGIVDIGIAGGDKVYIIQRCGLLLLLGIVGLCFSITAQFFSARAAVGFSARLRHALLAHIQTLSCTETDQIGSSTLMTRMTSDINQVQSGINLTLRLLLRSPFVVFGAMIMAFTVDVKSAWIFAVVIPLLSLVVFTIMAVSMPLYRKVQQKLDRVVCKTRENLTGVRVLRAFCKEEEEIAEFDAASENLKDAQKFVGRVSALMNPLTYVLINAAVLVLIYTGAWQVEKGILTQGTVLALYNYMSQILVELIKLANLIVNITKSLASAKRAADILHTESSMQDGSAVFPEEKNRGAVAFENVSFTYAGAGQPSLNNISFSTQAGRTVGIIGSTGSGKTSLVSLISRFYDVTEGAVLIDGRNVREYSLEALRREIGCVMQKPVLFSGSIRDNIRWGNREASDAEIWEALKTAQAADFVQEKEGGLDAAVEQGGSNFSGGQRQRLTIARALVRKPAILILDDASSALDYATDAALRKAVREMKPSPTVFMVSQRISSIQQADQIIVLEDGSAAGVGTHEDLLDSCPVYQEIYASQFQQKGEK